MRRGFTLVELLVTITIIALLIGLLIPVVSAVRRSAWNADTKNTISQLAGAITRYQQDHHAYPGMFPDSELISGVYVAYDDATKAGALSGTAAAAPYDHPITSSEAMLLSLCGGVYRNGANLAYDETRAKSSRGPQSLNVRNPKQYTAYMPASPRIISAGLMDKSGVPNMADSVVPEFVDGWPAGDQMPVLYLRARSGAEGIMSDAPGTTYQYDRRHLTPYLRAGDGLTALGTIAKPSDPNYDAMKVDDTPKGNALMYFRHPSVGGTDNANGTPVEKDRFLLIAPGTDRIYGTSDDIRSWGD